jgi:hypothetical protein
MAQALDPTTCEHLLHSLAQVLKDNSAVAPSELIELVDAVIQYVDAVDEIAGSTTEGLNDLIDARAAYAGPGIIPR